MCHAAVAVQLQLMKAVAGVDQTKLSRLMVVVLAVLIMRMPVITMQSALRSLPTQQALTHYIPGSYDD